MVTYWRKNLYFDSFYFRQYNLQKLFESSNILVMSNYSVSCSFQGCFNPTRRTLHNALLWKSSMLNYANSRTVVRFLEWWFWTYIDFGTVWLESPIESVNFWFYRNTLPGQVWGDSHNLYWRSFIILAHHYCPSEERLIWVKYIRTWTNYVLNMYALVTKIIISTSWLGNSTNATTLK